jgi:spore maturation protein CgeB
MKKQKILLVGERSKSSKGYAYADSFFDILTDLGYDVISFDGTTIQTIVGDYSWFDLNRIERLFFEYEVNRKFIEIVQYFVPDICFILKADMLSYKTLRSAKSFSGMRMVLFYPDSPFMFLNGNSNAQVVLSLSLFDVVLSWSRTLMPVFTSLGVTHTCYFPFGYDERFFVQKNEIEKRFDVSFVGTADDERYSLLDFLINALPQVSFGIWGNRWPLYAAKNCDLAKKYQGVAQYKNDMTLLLQSSAITLNPVRRQNYTSHNMRSLEAPAAGAFQIASYSEEHAKILFKENQSIVLYNNNDELVDRIKWYLGRENEREIIARNAHENVLQYSLQQMLKKFFLNNLCFC